MNKQNLFGDDFMKLNTDGTSFEMHAELQSLSDSERALLDLIWREGPISRKDLALKAGVTSATATRLTRRMSDLKLIDEMVRYDGVVGNPSRPLSRSANGAYSIGVSLAKGAVHICLTNLAGEVLHSAKKLVAQVGLNDIKECIVETIGDGLVDPAARRRILGVGVAIPGYRAVTAGEWAVHWDFPELLQQDIAQELTQLIGLPVYAERDAVAAALAERVHGIAKDISSYFYIYLAQGVGGCLVVNGKPVTGVSGNAGGLGALFTDEDSKPSAKSLLSKINSPGLNISSLYDIAPDVLERTPACREWISRAATSLKPIINIITRLHDPGTIIIGGQIPENILSILKDSIDIDRVETNYTAQLKPPVLDVSRLKGDALLFGAAALPIARLIQ